MHPNDPLACWSTLCTHAGLLHKRERAKVSVFEGSEQLFHLVINIKDHALPKCWHIEFVHLHVT